MQDVIGTTAVCLLPGPVVFFLKKTKTNLTKSIPNCVLLLQLFIQGIHSWQFFCFGGFCHRFHVSDGHKSTGTEFQLMMWQWLLSPQDKKKGKENNKRGCCYNLPAEKKCRGAPAKQRAWKRVLDQSEIPWMWFVVLVRSKPTVSSPV